MLASTHQYRKEQACPDDPSGAVGRASGSTTFYVLALPPICLAAAIGSVSNPASSSSACSSVCGSEGPWPRLSGSPPASLATVRDEGRRAGLGDAPSSPAVGYERLGAGEVCYTFGGRGHCRSGCKQAKERQNGLPHLFSMTVVLAASGAVVVVKFEDQRTVTRQPGLAGGCYGSPGPGVASSRSPRQRFDRRVDLGWGSAHRLKEVPVFR